MRPSQRCDHAWRNEQFYRYERDYEVGRLLAKIRRRMMRKAQA